MTFQEFLNKYNGQWVEVSGSSAQNQCVDLANAYIRDVLGLPIIEWANAKDFPTRAGSNYDYILNTPDGVPQEGDLIIWDGLYGHIAVFIEGNADSFRSFDQNYPTGSNCHVQNHNYTSPKVLGWLRAKKVEDNSTLINELRADRDKNWDLYQSSQKKVIEYEGVIEQKNKTIDALTKENVSDKQTIEDKSNEIKDLSNRLQDLTRKHDDVKVSLSVCEDRLSNRKDLGKFTIKELVIEILSRFHVKS